MMPQVIEVPNYGQVEFPDDMSEAEIVAAIKKSAMGYKRRADPETFDPTEGMSRTEKFLAGAGKGMTDLARGAGQMLGMVSDADIAEARRLDAPLMDSGYAKTGNIVGQAAALAPAALIPGANTYLGASVIGAGAGAMQPVAEGESRLANAGLGGAGGVVGQKIGNVIASKIGQRIADNAARKSQNAVRDVVLKKAQEQGLVIAPSATDSGVGSRLLEGLSGQIKTQQKASALNSPKINQLVAQDFNFSPNTPITKAALKQIRTNAGQAYDDVANTGVIDLGATNPLAKYTGSGGHHGGGLIKGVQVKTKHPGVGRLGTVPTNYSISAKNVVENIKQLKRDGNAYMSAYMRDKNPETLAKAKMNLGGADELEALLETHLQSIGKSDLLNSLKQSRQTIAKTYSAQRALKGGVINPAKLVSQLENDVPISGNMRLVAEFAQQAPKSAQLPKEGFGAPLTALDWMVGGGGSMVSPYALALPAARVAARSAILSQPYQRAFVQPQYGGFLLNAADVTRPALPYIGTVGGSLLGANY